MLLEQAEGAEQVRMPQHISVLTAEYIATGLDDPDYSAFEAADDSRIGDGEENGFQLTDAIVQSLRFIQIPTRTFANWRIPSLKNVIAIIADDAPAQESLLDVWRDFTIPFKTLMYTGAYVIEGTLYSDDEDPPEFYRQAFRPIEDATIAFQRGQNKEIIHVKLGLLHVVHIHGFSIENH